MNWRGRPLTSHEVIVNTIAATTTRTGLRVRAELDTGAYDTGARVSDRQMEALPLTRHDLRIPSESVHRFRSIPYTGSGVFVQVAGRL